LTITWEALVALCALITLLCGALALYVRMALSASLLEFEHRFFERLNGRYIKAELCEARHRETERRLTKVEEVQG
jgi:hypothetical protein